MAVDGPQGHCVKSDWYDLLNPKQSLVTARVKEVHGARRRQWNRGFTSQGMLSDRSLHNVKAVANMLSLGQLPGTYHPTD